MIETFLFIIAGTTVTMRGFSVEPDIVVPDNIVSICADINGVNPFNPYMSHSTELKLYDCYSAYLGYYD